MRSTQNELQQAVDVESGLRDTMVVEMREAILRASSGTLPQLSPQPPSIPVDFVAQFHDRMAREAGEKHSLTWQPVRSIH